MSVSEDKSLLDRITGYFQVPKPALKKTANLARPDAYGLEFQTRDNYYGHPNMNPALRKAKEDALNASNDKAIGVTFEAKPWKSLESNIVDDELIDEYIFRTRRSYPTYKQELPQWYKHGTSIYHIDEKQGGPQRNPRQIP